MGQLVLAPDLSLPLEAVARTFAIMSWLKRNGLVETPDFETVKLRAM